MKAISVKRQIQSNIHLFLGLFVILWINSGIFSYISVKIPDIMKMFVFFIWFFIACISKKNYLVCYFRDSLFLIIFFVILLIINYTMPSVDVGYYLKTTMFFMVIFSMFMFYYDRNLNREKKIIVSTLIIDYIFVGINTFIKSQEIPGISRYLSANEEDIIRRLGSDLSYFLGIGNYLYAYSMVMVGLFCVYKIMYTKHSKSVYVLAYVAILTIIIEMEFTIALLLLTSFTIILLFSKTKRNRNNVVITVNFALIILIIIILLLPQLLISFSELMPYSVAVRFVELSQLLSGLSIKGTDLNLRLSLYMKSVNAFLNNIFIGSLSGSGEIGGHSTWFDFLGQFGLVSLPIFIFYIKTYKNIIKRLTPIASIYVRNSFLYIMILGFINTVYSAGLLLTLFIFVPFAVNVYCEKPLLIEEE